MTTIKIYCYIIFAILSVTGILNGIAVAEGNGEGSGLNQLADPMGIFIADEKTIYITKAKNKHIVAWKHDSKNGQVIVDGNANDQLTCPTDVIFDKQNNSLITCDPENARVMRYCGGLTIDKNGFIYISDWHKNEVRQWIEGDQYIRIVVGGNGYRNGLNQFNHPDSLFVDEDQSVYVSDRFNHRVMKWKKDATEGNIVAGGNGQGNSLKELSSPRGVIVDHLGDKNGEIVIGGNSVGDGSNQLNAPASLSFDVEGNLYVADV
ncbi:unnamed protein product [Adineta steineri]|uniref:NHL repeat containing protein n=2 Tax=Adineta steineri TaxID=433720 RepID=A0A819QG07_9BILA|nr:unnamed protein product [Adineta steineri]